MRVGPDRVGLRGLSLLAVTALIGIGLAVYGYGRGVVIVSGAGTLSPGARLSARAAAPTKTTSASSNTSSTTSTAPTQKLGPLLSSTQYAPYAFRVYPGPESSQARLATAGFTLAVTPSAGTIKLSVSAAGSGQGTQTSTYPAGDKVYFIEASLGDDSGNVEYNFGDDGVVVTDARGYMVQ